MKIDMSMYLRVIPRETFDNFYVLTFKSLD